MKCKILVSLILIIFLSLTISLPVNAYIIDVNEETTTICGTEVCVEIANEQENIVPKLILTGVFSLVSLAFGIFLFINSNNRTPIIIVSYFFIFLGSFLLKQYFNLLQ